MSMEIVVQKTIVGAIRSRRDLQILQADLLTQVTMGLAEEMHKTVEQLVKQERKALKDNPDLKVLRVPQVRKAQLALRVKADIHMGMEDMAGVPEDHLVTNTAGTETTMTVTVEKATKEARPITATMVSEAMTDMLIQAGAVATNPAVDTAVMLDMEATLEISTEATDIRTAIKGMMASLGILPEDMMTEETKDTMEDTKETDTTPAETTAVVDSQGVTVIVATGAASNNSPWKV